MILIAEYAGGIWVTWPVGRSSGAPLLDDLTCRLFTARYRFRPATNARGEAVERTLWNSLTKKLFSFMLLFVINLGYVAIWMQQRAAVDAIRSTVLRRRADVRGSRLR